MPRPKNNILHDIFDRNEVYQVVCNRGKCRGRVLNDHSGNLERHLKVRHHEIYSKYIKQKANLQFKTKETTPRISKDVNKHNIELAIVELFTKNKRSLGMIEDRAFKTLVEPVFDALKIPVNQHTINERIVLFSQTLKAEIIEDLKGKLLSLKIDVATRRDLSMLGINVQYIKNKSLIIKTLAMKELSSNSSEYLKSTISEVLNDYSININQILTIITDNEENILKAVNDLDIDLENPLEDKAVKTEDLIAERFECIRCGRHILQLCVDDVLKSAEIQNRIEKCRSVSKELSTQAYLNILENGGYKTPIVDCVTSWNSTFNMIERLLDLREVINTLGLEDADIAIDSDTWSFIEEFIKIFSPIYAVAVRLQTEKLLFSDLYIIIMSLLFEIENFPTTEIKSFLIESLNRTNVKLLENELFTAAVFLDPRIKICLDADQISRARRCITSIHKRITSLTEMTPYSPLLLPLQIKEDTDEPSSSSSSNYQKPRSFSDYLLNMNSVSTNEPIASSFSQLESDLFLYERQPRLPLNENILDFWSTQDNTLSATANVLLAIPFTQITAEQLLSALDYVLFDEYSRSASFNLEDVLLVRVNGEFNYEDSIF